MKTRTCLCCGLAAAINMAALVLLTSCGCDDDPPLRSLAPFCSEDRCYVDRDLEGNWFVETPEQVTYASITNGVLMLYKTNGTERLVTLQSFNIGGRNYAQVLAIDLPWVADSPLAYYSSAPVHILCALEYNNDRVCLVTLRSKAVLQQVEKCVITGAVASATNSMFMTVSTDEWQPFLSAHARSRKLRGETLLELRRFSSVEMSALSPRLLTPHADTVTTRVVTFTWPPVRGAHGYRFQLGSDESFIVGTVLRQIYDGDRNSCSIDLLKHGFKSSRDTLHWRVQPLLAEKEDCRRALWTGPAAFMYKPPKPGKVANLTVTRRPTKPVADGTSLVTLVVHVTDARGTGVADTPLSCTLVRQLIDAGGAMLQPAAITSRVIYHAADTGGLGGPTGLVWNSVLARTDSNGYATIVYRVPRWQEWMTDCPVRLLVHADDAEAPASGAEVAIPFTRPAGDSATDRTARKAASSALLPEIYGAWELLESGYNGRVTREIHGSARTIRVITPSHFMWSRYDRAQRCVLAAAGGTYTLEGDRYVERVAFGAWSERDLIGHDVAYRLSLHGDTLRQSWSDEETNDFQEVWQRVVY